MALSLWPLVILDFWPPDFETDFSTSLMASWMVVVFELWAANMKFLAALFSGFVGCSSGDLCSLAHASALPLSPSCW